jgi:hypothetical protein
MIKTILLSLLFSFIVVGSVVWVVRPFERVIEKPVTTETKVPDLIDYGVCEQIQAEITPQGDLLCVTPDTLGDMVEAKKLCDAKAQKYRAQVQAINAE